MFKKKQQKNRRLYIFGGQRLKEDVNDLLYYDLEGDRVHSLCDNTSDAGIPPPGFTQRATIDDERGEIYMLAVSCEKWSFFFDLVLWSVKWVSSTFGVVYNY